jgi:hypothetical protein
MKLLKKYTHNENAFLPVSQNFAIAEAVAAVQGT